FAKDEDEDVRVKAAYALAKVAPESKEVVEAFTAALAKKDIQPAVRSAVIDNLKYFGAPALVPLATDDSWEARDGLLKLLDENKNEEFAEFARPYIAPVLEGPNDGLAYVVSKQGNKLAA